MATVTVEACIEVGFFNSGKRDWRSIALTANQEEAMRASVKDNEVLVSFLTKNSALAEAIAF